MELYLIRHADAAALGEGGVTEDANRPLSSKGEEQSREVAAGLSRQGVHPDIVVASPVLRARRTAEILAGAFPEPGLQVRVCDDLAPGGRRRRISRFINKLGASSVVLVGHQPDLGRLVGWLIGSKRAEIELAKAGVAHVHCDDAPGKGAGRLVSLVPPDWLSECKQTPVSS